MGTCSTTVLKDLLDSGLQHVVHYNKDFKASIEFIGNKSALKFIKELRGLRNQFVDNRFYDFFASRIKQKSIE